jgi:hypothetical protein
VPEGPVAFLEKNRLKKPLGCIELLDELELLELDELELLELDELELGGGDGL